MLLRINIPNCLLTILTCTESHSGTRTPMSWTTFTTDGLKAPSFLPLKTEIAVEPGREDTSGLLPRRGPREADDSRRHRAHRRRSPENFLRGIEDARRALRPVDCGAHDQADFVDEATHRKGPVGDAVAFQDQALHSEFTIQNF